MIELKKQAQLFLKMIFIVVGFSMPIEMLFAAHQNCGENTNLFSPSVIQYDPAANTNYCELCGAGQVRIIVTNPSTGDMDNFTVTHDFQASGLEYVNNSTTYSVNNGTPQAGGNPNAGPSGTQINWTSAQIPALNSIPGSANHNYDTVEIIFQVRSSLVSEEALVNVVNRNIQAQADYTFCPGLAQTSETNNSGNFDLPFREPEPTVVKRGRNIDAGQGNYTQTVYGNINDDVIWRIRINNNGLADLQDLRFDDVMAGTNFKINYACPTEGEAITITNDTNNGTAPNALLDAPTSTGNCKHAGSTSNPISNSIADFIVDNPYGNMGTSADGDEVDITSGGTTDIFLVGKILNSCDANSSNTVSDVQWGCEVDTPDGGISQTSGNVSAGTSATTLSSLVNSNNLSIVPVLTGLDTTLNPIQPAGSRGLMTITITNNSGGTIRDLVFTNTLPAEYVVDQTFTPRINVTPAYGTAYDGMVDTLDPLVPTALPENFRAPKFILTSNGVSNANHADQINMLRHGDVAVIQFRVVMVESGYFDNKANIDVFPEVDAVVGDNDPDNERNASDAKGQLANKIELISYKNFCDLSATQNLVDIDDSFDSFPEDLDINIPGSSGAAFILTNDINQHLPLQVDLINNGGHDADNYQLYVTFGSTMEVVTVPNGCNTTTNPPLLEVWDDPNDIPASANTSVYECNRGTISPGETNSFNFEVRKVVVSDTNGSARLTEDDLTFRADVIGEIVLSDNTLTGSGALTGFSVGGALLDFPTVPVIANGSRIDNRANNYSLDSIRAKVIGFNLTKDEVGYCSENIPAIPPAPVIPAIPDEFVEIGEECKFHIETGGWFGFQTPGFTYIAVKNIQVNDLLPNGQGFISTSVPVPASDTSIKNIMLNPPPAPLDVGAFNWTFNQVDQITIKDQWFRMDATTRILNDPINTRASPNVQSATSSNVLISTFDALFTSTISGPETISLDENAIGYPRVADRTVDLTITEPNILVTKEVCNETLSVTGNGAACTPFAKIVTNGDTQDSYVYRITLENEADDNGSPSVTRAPAYNITVTDVLDASDLMLVEVFSSAATDGLDNDGDGLVDTADGDGEGTISENVLTPLTPVPAVLTFSHTHSTALQKIIPGDTVQLYYRVNPDDQIAPLQQLVNTVSVTYDSLEGDSGNQTTPSPLVASNNGEAGGARVYNSTPPTTATVQILPLQAQPKEITRLSNTTIAGSPQAVSIGEEIEYQLRTSIPVANLRSFKIRDELPAGISCIEAPVVDLRPGGPYDAAGFVPGGQITPTCTNNLVEWDFGDQELTKATNNNLFDFAIRFIARVNNSVTVNNTNVISNGDPSTNVVLSYINEASTLVTQNFSQFSVIVQEPNIVLTKTYEVGNHDAGNVVTVTVTAENTGSATAYNLRVFDDLDAVSSLTFMNVTGTDPPLVDTALGANRPIFYRAKGHNDYDIIPGETISFTFEISVDLTAQPLEVLDNTLQASWQSLPEQKTALNLTGEIGVDGSATGMRNGAIPNVGNAINDYETTATTSSTVPAVTVTKTDLNPTQAPEVGVHKNYQIVINLPEGTTNNLVVNDNLNFADISYVLEHNAIYDISYTFSGITTINNGLAPIEANLISPPPVDGAQDTIIWNFGKVVTATEDDTTVSAITPSITINYYARIDNSITTNSGDRLQNQVTTNYSNGETSATEVLTNTTPIQTVTESALTVIKSSTNVTALPITSGDIIEYTLTISNATGNATAYDLNIIDTLPANLILNNTPTATFLISGNSVASFISTPQNSPAGPLIWGRGNNDNSLDIPAGETLILKYQVILDNGAESGTDYVSRVLVDWTSLDGASSYERTGAGCPTITAPNDYCVGPVISTITTVDNNAFTKAIIYDSYAPTNDSTVRIGDTVNYRLSLSLQEGTTRNVNVQDILPAGLSFVKIISINGDTLADYDSPASGTGSNFSYPTITTSSLPTAGDTGTINFSLGTVINDPLGDATTDILFIEYQVVVLDNTLTQIPTTTLTNTATLQFIDGNGAPVVDAARLQDTADLIVLQPILTMDKTASAAIAQIGTPITYTLKVQNTGDSPAYDVTVTDVLPTFDPAVGGMCDTTPTNIIARMYLADGTTPATAAALIQGTDYLVSYSGCTLTLTMQTTDTALAADNHLIITYESELDTDTPHSSTLINIAGATQWFSQDTAGAGATGEIQTYTRALTDGTVGTIDHEDAYSVTSDIPTVTIEKRVVNVTTGQDPGINATPGDTLRYGIYITNTSTVELFDFSFTDDLDALNAGVWYAAGTLNLVTIPAGADVTNTNANGGIKSSGLVDIRNLTLGAAGSGNETALIVFEVNLAASIPDATVVLNQGHMITNGLDFPTDDPNVVGATDPTETLISSAPLFRVQKISTDLTGDSTILESGDTLRYTITAKNIGTEDTINSLLRDQLPANTTYVAGSTTLNGLAVTEPIPGVLPLQTGILINAPENVTAGVMRADTTATTANVATITFDVTININVVNGTIISNQAYLSADGLGSGTMADQPSDDPDTVTPNDPTRDVVGNQPLLDALKTVSIVDDKGTTGVLDPDDIIRYTITISNIGAADATLVTFTDTVPTNTTYISNSVTLNGLPVAQPDLGISPLISGIDISSSNLTPPLPGAGTISRGESAVITFDVQVNSAVAVGTVISNQGFVDSYELPIEPTDADGIDINGDQPTLIVVGNAQLLSIVKSVAVVGGGPAVAGGQLEYRVFVTNISSVPASNLLITDNLDLPVANQVTYVAGSALLDGLAAGVSFSDPVITADYYAVYGDLPPGASTELRFLVEIDNMLPIGTTITNTATVYWNAALLNASATISIDVGAIPGVANVNGTLWHDANLNNILDNSELVLAGWFVDVYRNSLLLGTVISDANGVYSINGLLPNYIGTERYELKFRSPGSTSTTALLGLADSPPALNFINGLHHIYDMVLYPGTNVLDLNLPIDPNGVVYNSVERVSIAGATISLLNAGTGLELSSSCFDDINQQNQVTTANGYYKFDINFSQSDCFPGGNYLIRITPPATGYSQLPSVAILPQTDATTAAFDVPGCPATALDAISATVNICEAQTSEFNPAFSVPPVGPGTYYYLHLTLDDGSIPEDSQLFNNHLPIDPVLNTAVSISKVTPMVNVTRSQLIPYTITVRNKLTFPLSNTNVVDTFPAGFKYVKGSARLNGSALEPIQNGLQLTWSNIDLIPDEVLTFKLLLIVGAAVNEGEYINRAHVFDTLTQSLASGIATATVRVVPDPTFDCSDVIGKVFDDKNLNGYQDENEKGIAGTRVITVRGLNVTSDKYGRFHLTCAVVPDETRGSNFIIKLDERSLPTGYRVTTENPRVQRATRGKMLKFNFGAAIHRVVSMDIADGVFEKDSDEMHSQWLYRIDLLLEQLKDKPSILRLSYLADIEDSGLVDDRLEKVQEMVLKKWKIINSYDLKIETEIFWRRGGPPDVGDID